MDRIYVVTTMHIPEKILKDNKYPYGFDLKSRTVGFCFTFEDANDCVVNNMCDIYEDTNNIVVIEEAKEGFYNSYENSYWYKYDKKTKEYVRIEKPECFSKIVGFGIG